MRCNFALFYFFAIYMLSDYRALCDYVVEVNLRSYNNPESRAAGNKGECCDPAENSDLLNDGICTEDELCDNVFSFCLRSNSQFTECFTPTITTNIIPNSDSLNFTSTDFGVPNPLTWTVNGSWQNNIQLFVMVVDKDNGTQDDLVDTFTIQLGNFLQINSAAGLMFSIRGSHTHVIISLTAKVYCAPFHYGGQCQFFDACERFNQSCNGNGQCTDEELLFICNCNPGYTGIDCGININDCEYENCSGNGRCIDEINSYHCECVPGFSGTNCETNIDECDGQNCSGKGLCMDGINSYACACFAGYTGDNCSTNIDDCEFQNCSGSGECMNGINSYICVCNTEFTGMNCETNIDDCVNQDCNGLGTCIDGVNSFSCNCDPPFTGSLCERIDYCYGVNCNRNGRCVNEHINFTCKCNLGFTGELCSMDMQLNGVGDGVVIEALGGVTAALILLVLVIILLPVACLVRKRKSTHFSNGWTHEDNEAYGIPNNSLERTTSTKLSNTMRSEFKNTNLQSTEVNNTDYEEIDLTRISQ